jgi:hypothetical protein
MTIQFAAANATGISIPSGTSATCTVPAGSGEVSVTVTSPGGTSTLPAAFTYEDDPGNGETTRTARRR